MITQPVGDGLTSDGNGFYSIEGVDLSLERRDPARHLQETCGSHEPFTVTSAKACLEGCYSKTSFPGLGGTYSTLGPSIRPQPIVLDPNGGRKSEVSAPV